MPTNDLEILKQAILNETEGYEFYLLAAKNTGDGDANQAFLTLAGEELKHIEWLKDLYADISAQKPVSLDVESIGKSVSPDIFKWSTAGKEKGSLAVSVFGIGIQMEKASVDFYRKAAEKSIIKEAKALYRKLVEWEQSHLNAFESIYDTLKEEWWEKQGFSPS